MRRIVFGREAQSFGEALPIGNGRLGAMVWGGVKQERLQLNEDSVWYGKPIDRHNPDAYGNLERVRELILGGRPDAAERLLSYAFTATPQSQRIYQPLGDCWLNMYGSCAELAEDTGYDRGLNLKDATVSVSYKTKMGSIEREYFASYPHQVIAVKLEARKGERLNFDLLLTREKFYDEMIMDEWDGIYLTGNLGKGGLDFVAGAKIKVEEGSVNRIGEHLVVQDAKRAYLYLNGTSTFYQENPLGYVKASLQAASDLGWDALRAAHAEDYQRLFGAVRLQLGAAQRQAETEQAASPQQTAAGPAAAQSRTESELTTAQRLAATDSARIDPELVSLYFDFGRYLLISCSRPGSQPANLQGIWNEKMMPPWESKYTININTEMNYWMAESLGLSECMEPLFDLIERMRQNGRKTAWNMYRCRGFMCHHNTDIWADTAPQDQYIPATYWTQGAAFLVLFLWRHYEYHQDRKWLEQWFPVLEEAVLFYLDFLIEDQGEYVTCPSVSPENTYIMGNGVHARVCAGPSMDNQMLRDLFDAYEKAAGILGRADNEKVLEAKRIREKLPPIKIGKYGQIMEWREDYEEEEPGHRHISQLYALYPSSQITLDETPELAEAARATLDRRVSHGGGHTGWSAAWLINFYAQLGMAEEAGQMIRKLFVQSTFDNLMDNHPHVGGAVFQIDGNLGGCDAIAQMLVQDNGRRVLLLPACLPEWEEGRFEGVRLKGNAELSFQWTKETVSGTVRAYSDWNRKVVCCGKTLLFSLKAGERKAFVVKKQPEACFLQAAEADCVRQDAVEGNQYPAEIFQ